MRRTALLLSLTLVACAKADKPATDTAATTPVATETPPPPAMLKASDVAGSWSGATMATASDSVLRRWTTMRVTDSTAKLMLAGVRDTIDYGIRYDADSMIAVSKPYTNPAAPKGPKLIFRSIGRLRDGKLVGTVATMLATAPDSAVERSRWEATRLP